MRADGGIAAIDEQAPSRRIPRGLARRTRFRPRRDLARRRSQRFVPRARGRRRTRPADRVAVREAMERRTVAIAEAGMTTALHSRGPLCFLLHP